MHFNLVDRVLEQSDDRIITIKQVSRAEEYLQDHFADFPVLPGVFMVESLVQAARCLAERKAVAVAVGPAPRLVLGGVRALKYGSFVRPGEVLRVEVQIHKVLENGAIEFKGEGTVLRPGEDNAQPPVAVSGRFTLRPIRIA